MNKILQSFGHTVVVPVLFPTLLFGFSVDSIFEPFLRSFDLLPDYYLRFNVSTFAFHRDAFFKRQYLAEPHPDLEFRLISYRDVISSIWDVDFVFGLGEVPGNTVFTVLNVAFGINPKFELRLPRLLISTGVAHHCYHEIDKSYFPLVYNNRLHLEASSHNFRINDYFNAFAGDTLFRFENRFSWQIGAAYFLKEFFGVVDPGKLNGSSPLTAELASRSRYAFHRRRSWIFSFRGETTIGLFDTGEGYRVKSNSACYWKQTFGVEAFFSRGARGGCFYLLYHRDDLPRPPDSPEFTLGNSRFSKNGLVQIGMVFFN
ncbi:MAG: hypothetical protein JW913_13175 [Chitinispirillaceae bacterium]|nr:hypothetical protein [Chitinispirillaceae bacterium]